MASFVPSVDDPVVLPAEPVAQVPTPFPVVASFAPVLVSLVMWAVTRSPYVLVFAALGPIMAIGGAVDGKWGSRRRLRRDLAAFERELARVTETIDARHRAERHERRRETPPVRNLIGSASTRSAVERWRRPRDRRTVVVLGEGERPSRVRVDGAVTERTRALAARAAVIGDVPVEVDVVDGLGIAGPAPIARAYARGLLLQLCDGTAPGAARLAAVPESGWSWARLLPHSSPDGDPDIVVRIVEDDVTSDGAVVLAIADRVSGLPPGCRHVVELSACGEAVLHGATPLPLSVDLVTESQASGFAVDLAEQAKRLGLVRGSGGLVTAISYADACAVTVRSQPRGLEAVIGVGERGPAVLDLVEHGPHAIVGGTTGSGKSELLMTWAASIADRFSPDQATLLLIDFKGGAAFAPLGGLPHVVGVITDLDEAEAARALESLRAELRFRERALREVGARDISEAGGSLARLVIVVDEFAAMLDGFPDLHALFVDIAARGRSLGVHLVLCTQRPAGVVRESLLANCGLRLSLRVNNRADSVSIVGTDAAAKLPSTVPGRLVAADGDGEITTVQVATVTDDDLARISERWRDPSRIVRRPWLDPLPPRVLLDRLEEPSVGPAAGIRLGLADLPHEQRRTVARYRPEHDGNLLVLGTSRSGKTTLIDTIECDARSTMNVLRPRDDAERLWDLMRELGHGTRAATQGQTLVLIDDLDSLCARLDDDYATELCDMIVRTLRDGPGRRIRLVIAAHRLGGPLGRLSGFIGSTVFLRLPNRQEHLLAGADASHWIEHRRPGSAVWQGHEIQVALAEPCTVDDPASTQTAPDFDIRSHDITLVVSRDANGRAERIRARHAHAGVRVASLSDTGSDGQAVGRLSVADVAPEAGPVVLVGDAELWQSHWSLFTALRPRAQLLFDGCTIGEFRAISRQRELPPLLAGEDRAWHIAPSGETRRVRL